VSRPAAAPAFAVFLLAYVLSQFYRSFLAVIAPELAAELQLDPQGLGNLQAWWILGFAIMQIPVGYALDHWGPRRSVFFIMLPAVLGAALFSGASSALVLDAAIMLIGIGCSAPFMGALYVFGRSAHPSRFAFLTSLLLGLGSSGNLLAASPLAWAAATYGWRPALLALAGFTGLSALLILLVVRDPPRPVQQSHASLLRGLVAILKLRPLWPLLPLTAVSYAVILAERGLWAGPYFSSVYGLTPAERGDALLAVAAAMSAGALAYGPLDRWLNTRKWVVAAGSLLTASGFLVLAVVPLGVTTAIAVLALTAACAMTYGVLMAHGRALFPEQLLGRGITFMNILFIGGAGVLQPVSGAMMAAMQTQPPAIAYARLHAIFGLLLLGALLVYLLARDIKPR
jgi:MFS family permease